MSASTGETELAAKGRPNTKVVQCLVLHDLSGEVVEWFMALVLKTDQECKFQSVTGTSAEVLGPFLDRFPRWFRKSLPISWHRLKRRVKFNWWTRPYGVFD